MDVTLRCRAYPDEETASEAWRHIEIHRQIQNHAIRDYYSYDYGNRPTDYDQHRKLTDWKQQWPLFSEVSAHAAQQTVSEIRKNVETQKGQRENGHKAGRVNYHGSGDPWRAGVMTQNGTHSGVHHDFHEWSIVSGTLISSNLYSNPLWVRRGVNASRLLRWFCFQGWLTATRPSRETHRDQIWRASPRELSVALLGTI